MGYRGSAKVNGRGQSIWKRDQQHHLYKGLFSPLLYYSWSLNQAPTVLPIKLRRNKPTLKMYFNAAIASTAIMICLVRGMAIESTAGDSAGIKADIMVRPCSERFNDNCRTCFDLYPFCRQQNIPSQINWYANPFCPYSSISSLTFVLSAAYCGTCKKC